MRADSIIGVICEGIAFAAWAYHFTELKEIKYQLFTAYLGIVWVTETCNLIFWKSDNSITNLIVNNFNVMLQFIFLFYFLVVEKSRASKRLFWVLSTLILSVFILEKSEWLHTPKFFPSLSFGVGNLLLTSLVIYKTIQIFKNFEDDNNSQQTLHLIILGIILFYIGGFPYQNFRNYFWSHKSMYPTAYLLHYLTQFFCYSMYLLFSLSVKWKIK